MEEILLEDLLQILKTEKHARVMVKFNQWNGYASPMDEYKADPDKVNIQWLFWRTKRKNFRVGDVVICFLELSNNKWLLTTIKKITKDLDKENAVNYEGEELKEFKKYFGRVIVMYHKKRSQCYLYKKICKELIVNGILPTQFDGEDFPGYDKVRLSYSQLEAIIKRGKRDWVSALTNQKAVYLITDIHTGKLYVGSATGEEGMLLQRWQSYVGNGHGGNKGLIELVNKEGLDYVRRCFQYSILENYNAKVDDKIILEREAWWKGVLGSRDFGYNKN